jgi:carboxypeptidase C (cathepsin A)
MTSLKVCLLFIGLLHLTLGGILPPNYLFRPKSLPLNDYTCSYSPEFDYPISQTVDKQAANISDSAYPGNFYTGYVPVSSDGAYIFYVLYPADGDSDANASLNNSKPLVMWMQGGPGCADWIGNFGEIGPLRILNTTDGGQEVVKADVNWNTGYNLLFIDQPPGVGFSPAGSSNVTDSMQAADIVISFLEQFLGVYTSLQSNPFYIFGESYGGHYIPAVASSIIQKGSKINLAGIGIGDGLTDPKHQGQTYAEYGYMAGFLSTSMRDQLNEVEIDIPNEFNKGNFSGVSALFDQITGLITNPNITGIFSPYDYRDGPAANLAAPYTFYLNDAGVRTAFALDPTVDYSDCADPMYTAFYNDIGQSYAPNITYLLDKGIPVVLYNGEDDIIINTPGARSWIRNLDWEYIHQFENSKTQTLNDQSNNIVGTVKTFQKLSFVVVYKAGHTVPSYQPVAARLIIDGLINGDLGRADQIYA